MATMYGKSCKYIWLNIIFNFAAITILFLSSVSIIFIFFKGPGFLHLLFYPFSLIVIIGPMYIYANTGYEHDDPAKSGERKLERGRREIYKKLRKLPSEYKIFYDLKPENSASIDFVVVGHGNVCVIEVKSCQKSLNFNGWQFFADDKIVSGSVFLKHILNNADYLNSQLDVFVGIITPIIVIIDSECKIDSSARKHGYVEILTVDELSEFLIKKSAGRSLNDSFLQQIEERLSRLY